MRFISVMEWNLKATSEWDWENLAMYSDKTVDSSCEIGGDKIAYNGSIYKSQGCILPCFDMGQGSSIKSSITTSVDSSLQDSTKRFEMADSLLKHIDGKKEIAGVVQNGNFSTSRTSVSSGEEMIGLKLGSSTYFEDVYTTSTMKTTSFSVVPASSSASLKRARVSYHSMQTPRCQVEGCNLDLTSAKDYHRRHRICESHSKSPKVIVAGMERRFCQQCSRFHELSEFDDKKRSCRRRLSDHNARRRRPQPEAIQFSSAQPPSSLLDQRSQVNILVNGFPVPVSKPTWEGACTFKVMLAGNSLIRPVRAGGTNRKLHFHSDEMPTSIFIPHFESERVSSFQGMRNQFHYHGLEAPAITSNVDASPDLQRALSLLSTTDLGSNEPKLTSLEQLMHGNVTVAQQGMHSEQSWALASPEYVEAEQAPPESQLTSLDWHGTGSQLLKTHYEPNCFHSNQII